MKQISTHLHFDSQFKYLLEKEMTDVMFNPYTEKEQDKNNLPYLPVVALWDAS